jgi:hypothetical protein
MLSGTVEPACRRPLSSLWPGSVDALSGRDAAGPTLSPVSIFAPDAPDEQATAVVTRATIQPIANRGTTAAGAPFLVTTQCRVGTKCPPDWPARSRSTRGVA